MSSGLVWNSFSTSCMYGPHNPIVQEETPIIPSITAILQRLTGERATLLQPDASLAVCREIGYTGWRDRVLTPVTTVLRFLWQILHGNTACRHLPHLSGLRFTAAASCQARARLPRRVFALLLQRFSRAVQRRGRRAVACASHLPRRWLGQLDA